ncbi:MAG: EamA family transporter, partial [Flavobacteriales bacterium]
RNVIAGLVLGIFNYFSIYFLLRALQNDFINSSSIFTINNVAIVLLSTIFGILFFKETLSKMNWFGIGLAVISIILVATT